MASSFLFSLNNVFLSVLGHVVMLFHLQSLNLHIQFIKKTSSVKGEQNLNILLMVSRLAGASLAVVYSENAQL